jgi:uncharacterized protein
LNRLPSLSERLKALGVTVGIADLMPVQARQEITIESVVPGRLLETPSGEAYIVDQYYTRDYQHSPKAINSKLSLTASRDAIAQWVREPLVATKDPTSFAFLDTETSGLNGGTGTYAFLVGVGRFEANQFHLAQFFMRDPSEESSLLTALEAFLAPCTILVTFNGKAFDVPLLNTRYLLQGWRSPLGDMVQVDLLHLARKIWRDRLPSRTLGNLEYQILGTTRSAQEVPGWMIPQIYFDYLRSGDARPMESVFYHNAMDVLSLATLLDHCAHLLAAPHSVRDGEELEQVALARFYEDLGEMDTAVKIYHQCMTKKIPLDIYWEIIQRLSFIYKSQNQKPLAIPLWEHAAQNGHIYAHIELAKIEEHENRNYESAIHWTESALELLHSSGHTPFENLKWKKELEHRLHRLRKKMERLASGGQSSSEENKV